MVDSETLKAYDSNAQILAAGHRALISLPTRQLLQTHFHPAGSTADVGCGSGRDTAWLNAVGFPTIGYDASVGMLAEAARVYPQLTFRHAMLPDLVVIPDNTYSNVLCNAVLMHLPPPSLPSALVALTRILRPGGCLVIAYRRSRVVDEREPDGRLYTSIVAETFGTMLVQVGLLVRQHEHIPDALRAGVVWHTWVAQRGKG